MPPVVADTRPMRQLSEGQKAAGREARRGRIALHLTQEQVAHEADISTRQLRDFENGKSWPRNVAAISHAIGKPADELEEYAVDYDRRRGTMSISPRVADLLVEIDALEDIQRRQLLDEIQRQDHDSVNTGQ